MNGLPSDNTQRMCAAAEQYVMRALRDQVTRKGEWNPSAPSCPAELHPEIELLFGLSTSVVYDRGYEIYIELDSDYEFESVLKRYGFTGSFDVTCRRRHRVDDIEYHSAMDFDRVRPSIDAQLERIEHTDVEVDEFVKAIAELTENAMNRGL